MIGKRRLSPSKSAWMRGDEVQTKYEKSCPRFVVWERRFEKEATIDPIYEAMGTLDETRYAVRLDRAKVPYRREVEISYPIGQTGINIEGRIDFVESRPEGDFYTEKKSTISLNRYREIIQKNQVDPHHLAQLVSYMAVNKVQNGQVVITYWKWDDTVDGLVVGAERAFLVHLTPGGDITVDGQPYAVHVRHLQQWYHTCAKAMQNADVALPERPYKTPKPAYQNPCTRCPLAESCNKYDRDKDINAFWTDTQKIEIPPGPAAKIVEPKLEKGKKNDNQISNSIDSDSDSGRIQDKTGKQWW